MAVTSVTVVVTSVSRVFRTATSALSVSVTVVSAPLAVSPTILMASVRSVITLCSVFVISLPRLLSEDATPFAAESSSGFYSPYSGLRARESYYTDVFGNQAAQVNSYSPLGNLGVTRTYYSSPGMVYPGAFGPVYTGPYTRYYTNFYRR